MASLATVSAANRPLVTLMNHSGGYLDQICSKHEDRKCSRPCQRIPNMVKLQPLLVQSGKTRFGNNDIARLIEATALNSYGEIDIGRCVGSCRAVKSETIRVSPL